MKSTKAPWGQWPSLNGFLWKYFQDLITGVFYMQNRVIYTRQHWTTTGCLHHIFWWMLHQPTQWSTITRSLRHISGADVQMVKHAITLPDCCALYSLCKLLNYIIICLIVRCSWHWWMQDQSLIEMSNQEIILANSQINLCVINVCSCLHFKLNWRV